MTEMRVDLYAPEMRPAWDTCIQNSRNGSFLHQRNFMDYHAHRFVDASVLVRDEKGNTIAVLPANRDGDRVISHGGLTYAGLLMTERLTQTACLQVFDLIAAHYRAQGIKTLLYKAVPHVFHRTPCEEDLYALFRQGARLVRRDASSVISLRDAFAYSKGRKWSVNKARKTELSTQPAGDPADFHALLSTVLARHGAQPVHSLDELRLLMGRFPENVVLHECRLAGELHAGALIFDFGNAVHTQYLAASEQGRDLFALDFLLAHLIETVYAERRWFSFGASTEKSGQILNEGLVAQKEGFGARAVIHDFYDWNLGA